MTSSWDVFHSVRLEVDRGVATEVVRARLLDGALNGDDLIRPAGTTRWSRIAQVAAFNDPAATDEPPIPPELPSGPPVLLETPVPVPPPVVAAPIELPPEPEVEPLRLRPEPDLEPTPDLELPPEDEDDSVEAEPVNYPELALDEEASVEAEPVHLPEPAFDQEDSVEAEPVDATGSPYRRAQVLPDDEAGGPDPVELGDPVPPELEASDDAEDDPAADFTLTRNSTERVEELDLAAMVDVAFQLVLFFLVTASTIVFKTLEVPKPNEDKPPEAAAQSRAKSIDELEKDYILVEVDAEGAMKIDHLPVNADRAALIEKLRQARETTGRKAMLLSADFATRHRSAVLAFDVASEIDLQIAIAQPVGKN